MAGGSTAQYITDLEPGATLSANDVIVIGTNGDSIVGRPTSYELKTGAFTAAYNGNYNLNVGTSFSVNLPAGVVGGVIGFADISGTIDATHTVTLSPNGSEKIMNQTGGTTLVINDYPYISFKLVYVSAAFGWTLTEMQR